MAVSSFHKIYNYHGISGMYVVECVNLKRLRQYVLLKYQKPCKYSKFSTGLDLYYRQRSAIRNIFYFKCFIFFSFITYANDVSARSLTSWQCNLCLYTFIYSLWRLLVAVQFIYECRDVYLHCCELLYIYVYIYICICI